MANTRFYMAEALKTKKTRTSRSFQAQQPLLPIVKAWTKEAGFTIRVDEKQIYCEKGMGLMTAPIVVTLEETAGDVKFEAYLKVDMLSLLSSLFMAPEEMQLESGDGPLYLERKFGRDKVNPLLVKLGQPVIE